MVQFDGRQEAARLPYEINDYGTGILAAFATALALFHRTRTGPGQRVEAALAYTATLHQSLYLHDFAGKSWGEPSGPETSGTGPGQPFDPSSARPIGRQSLWRTAANTCHRPRVLVLDEPSRGLARIIIAEIYRALERLRDDGLTILLIEQAATTAIAFADHTAVLVGGRIVLQGERAELLASGDVVRHYPGASDG
jgi:crotonobetainyl-CoA:carnitine CoA-transferase CaiB-like acyl-CoA transferase